MEKRFAGNSRSVQVFTTATSQSLAAVSRINCQSNVAYTLSQKLSRDLWSRIFGTFVVRTHSSSSYVPNVGRMYVGRMNKIYDETVSTFARKLPNIQLTRSLRKFEQKLNEQNGEKRKPVSLKNGQNPTRRSQIGMVMSLSRFRA